MGLFALLAALTLTAAIVALLWDVSRVGTLLVLCGLYAIATALLYQRLAARLQSWDPLPGTLDQLAKDRACFKESLE